MLKSRNTWYDDSLIVNRQNLRKCTRKLKFTNNEIVVGALIIIPKE